MRKKFSTLISRIVVKVVRGNYEEIRRLKQSLGWSQRGWLLSSPRGSPLILTRERIISK
jgi:hypothetical protein